MPISLNAEETQILYALLKAQLSGIDHELGVTDPTKQIDPIRARFLASARIVIVKLLQSMEAAAPATPFPPPVG